MFHHSSAFDYLRKKHFPGPEQIAYFPHAFHQRAFNDFDRSACLLSCFLSILFDELGDSFDQRIAESFFDRAFTPAEILSGCRRAGVSIGLGDLHQPFSCIGSSIQNDVFDRTLEVLRDLIVNRQLSCVDNSHRQASFDGVVKKDRMDGFSDGIVAAE